MNLSPEKKVAAEELAEIQRQTDIARVLLLVLEQEVVTAGEKLVSREKSELLEANEQLVFAMLRAHEAADASAEVLKNVSHAAELDRLTRLPNRMLLLDRFRVAIVKAGQHGRRLALLFLDLNKFKQINHMLGHAAGDDVLKHAALCLNGSVRATDTVSRHGGAEFLVLLTDIGEVGEVVAIVEKIIAALGVPTRIGNHMLSLTASTGISLYPDDGEDTYSLIDRADAAMYRAKRQGIGGYAFHSHDTIDEHSRDGATVQALLQPVTHFKLATTEPERRHRQRRAADEELVAAAQQAQQLQAVAEQAQQRQSELLAVVAHELRNPMAPLLTAAALIGRVEPWELPRMQGVIERQVAHLGRLVDDLLDVSRVKTGKLHLIRSVVNLNKVIELAVQACRPAIDTRLQSLQISLPAPPVMVHGDQIRLTQVLSNLLDNASKYTPNSGAIGLAMTRHGGTVVVAISDTGIGITKDALTHVFEPFVQESHAIGFNRDGLGIGLTLVRELIESHGGSVVAHSAGAGQGSTFTVTLPLLARPASTYPGAPG